MHPVGAKGCILFGGNIIDMFPYTHQDESRSISENSTWGIRRRFEQGRVVVNHVKFLGYDKDEQGNLIINEIQAKIVRRIYAEYLNGKGPAKIARELENDKVLNWNGKIKWYESSIKQMLGNEKYKGDALLQKTYTVDFLTKKRVVNDGQMPQYYVEESHPAIIDRETWECVQFEMKRRKEFAMEHNISKVDYATSDNPFAGRVICGSCGGAFGRKVWNSTDDRLRRIIWRCNSKYTKRGEKGCGNKHIDDSLLKNVFMNAFNVLIDNKQYFLEKWDNTKNSDNLLHKYRAKQLMDIVLNQTLLTEFSVNLYFKVIEKFTIIDSKKIIVTLLDGTDIECEIE